MCHESKIFWDIFWPEIFIHRVPPKLSVEAKNVFVTREHMKQISMNKTPEYTVIYLKHMILARKVLQNILFFLFFFSILSMNW